MSKLFSTTCIPQSAEYILTGARRRFTRQEDGSATVFAVVTLLLLLLVGGIGVDLMRNEMERVKIQNVSDRAVLAAADLNQPGIPSEVVQDYFEKSGLGDRANSVNVSEGLNFRTVSVNADAVTPTNFMNLLGIDSLPLRSFAEAEERVNNVEISLVLDISGSMAWDNRIANMQDAAKEFVSTVLRPETQDLVSISLVPYSGHVSAGPNLMSKFNVDYSHPYSHCLEFDDEDFSSATLDRGKTYDQVQHFYWNFDGYSNDTTDPSCPDGANEDIQVMSQDITSLHNQIDALVPTGSTSIFAGMKWAAGLLDPDFQNITTSLVQDNEVDPIFAARPAAYGDEETLKTVVLMTDGEHDYSYRISSRYYANASHAEHWNRYNLNWYLANYVHSYYRSSFRYAKYSPSLGNSLLYNICDAAKEKNIVIWSIGFEVTDNGADVMKRCASSPSHFFRVEGVEITSAFKAIARQINQLRLTQ